MFDESKIKEIGELAGKWSKKSSLEDERAQSFVTTSGYPVKSLYTPVDIKDTDYARDISFPAMYPFTRGVHQTGYRGRLWTMRMFSGFGTAAESNRRYKFLLQHGETGLSVAFDYPTLMGYDTDDEQARGEFGKCGVAVSSVADMQLLFDGIPMEQVSTSMTINGPAAVIWAMYIAAAEKQGAKIGNLKGTIQNDILKEYIAQNSYIFPPQPSLKLVVDTVEFGSNHLPFWNTVSISGYHIREAGSTALQELAFTLADGLTYVQAGMDRGLKVDEFAHRLSFFFNCHNDFFEEVAKFRAARRIWAQEMKNRFRAEKERSMWLRFHTQTAGCSLTAQQPENNIVRTTIQALAAVMGGTQSLHTNSMDEAIALPTETAVRVALRTQQIIASESGVINSIDPLGGSYLVEAETNRMEDGTYEYFKKIEAMGGVVEGIKRGFFQREIAESAYRYQGEIESGRRTMVGINDYVVDEPIKIPVFKLDEEGERQQIERLRSIRRERDNREASRKLNDLRTAAKNGVNLMPYILDAVKAGCTLGETCAILREVYGEYREPVFV